jgi:hypothetical protein
MCIIEMSARSFRVEFEGKEERRMRLDDVSVSEVGRK